MIYNIFPLQRGSIQDHIDKLSKKSEKIPEEQIWTMFRGLCQAVKEFHSQNPPYAHRYDQKRSLQSLTFSSLKNMIITVYLFFYQYMQSLNRKVHLYKQANSSAVSLKISLICKMCWRCFRTLDPFFSFCRDIKPANVMIADDGSPILMDLGSANLARVEVSNAKISRQLQVLLLVIFSHYG